MDENDVWRYLDLNQPLIQAATLRACCIMDLRPCLQAHSRPSLLKAPLQMSDLLRVTPGRLLKTWALNLRSSLMLIFSGGKDFSHEGRYLNGSWTDWTRAHSCRPAHYHEPTTEAEICSIVASASKVRVVGDGHSFNDAMLTYDTMISLDKYNGAVLRDHRGSAAPRAGPTRRHGMLREGQLAHRTR